MRAQSRSSPCLNLPLRPVGVCRQASWRRCPTPALASARRELLLVGRWPLAATWLEFVKTTGAARIRHVSARPCGRGVRTRHAEAPPAPLRPLFGSHSRRPARLLNPAHPIRDEVRDQGHVEPALRLLQGVRSSRSPPALLIFPPRAIASAQSTNRRRERVCAVPARPSSDGLPATLDACAVDQARPLQLRSGGSVAVPHRRLRGFPQGPQEVMHFVIRRLPPPPPLIRGGRPPRCCCCCAATGGVGVYAAAAAAAGSSCRVARRFVVPRLVVAEEDSRNNIDSGSRSQEGRAAPRGCSCARARRRRPSCPSSCW